MKRMVTLSLLLVTLCFAGRGGAAEPQTTNAARALVEKTENDLIEALREADTNALDRLLADDYISTNPQGVIRNKQQVLNEFVSGSRHYDSIFQDDVAIRLYGNVAVVTSRRTEMAESKGRDSSGLFRSTRVYVNDSGVWRAVALQTTRIVEPGTTQPDFPEAPGVKPGGANQLVLQLKWVPQAQFAGFYVAQEKGFYRDEGLEVVLLSGGPNIIPEHAVAAGKADFGIAWLPSVLSFRERGIRLQTIAQLFQFSGMRVISFAESGINSSGDLRGKKVSVWPGHTYKLFSTLAKYSLDPNRDLVIVPQGLDLELFLQRRIDAASAMTYNELLQVLAATNSATSQRYQLKDLHIIDFNREGTAMLEDGIIARDQWLQDPQHRDRAERFLRASFKGWIFCREHPEEAVESVLKANDNLKRSEQLAQLREVNKLIWPSPQGIGMMDPAKWQQTATTALRYGLLKRSPDPSAYTNELVEKALAKLSQSDVTGVVVKPGANGSP